MADLDTYLCFCIRAAMKKIDKNLSSRLQDYGISIPQSFILFCLKNENGITLKEIGNRTLIDSSSMTVLVDKLEKDNLVARQLDLQDRRAIRVFITEKGKKIAGEVSRIGNEFNSHLYDLLGEGNQKEFIHGIKNITNGLD
ncbi:MAG: MarR family transcriptional regulator [Syntrophomonadaceae bacterium]|nr:MarR family transcriptional regulator [Syntrophomonadaceae bacterium]MDD3888445.1 MarR family transcriptional regulator [Syntrophomonadaceae bacterium]MDD4549198.1 MarR family transcriptional regulator [Syntrophomonadaceae bacterium]